MALDEIPLDKTAVDAGFGKAGLDTARRHVFLCLGPDCCSMNEGAKTWERLKAGLKDKGIPAMRTKAACLRVCSGGPWMVVYPDGVWYGQVTPERCDRIVDQHLGRNEPVAEWVVRRHPLEGQDGS